MVANLAQIAGFITKQHPMARFAEGLAKPGVGKRQLLEIGNERIARVVLRAGNQMTIGSHMGLNEGCPAVAIPMMMLVIGECSGRLVSFPMKG